MAIDAKRPDYRQVSDADLEALAQHYLHWESVISEKWAATKVEVVREVLNYESAVAAREFRRVNDEMRRRGGGVHPRDAQPD